MRAGRGHSTLPTHGILDWRPGSNEEGNAAADFPHPILKLIFISVTRPPSLSALKLHTRVERAAARRKCRPRQHNSSHPALMHFNKTRSSLIFAVLTCTQTPCSLCVDDCSCLVYHHYFKSYLFVLVVIFKQQSSEPG